MEKFRNFTSLFVVSMLLLPALVSAHVVVTPSQVGVAAEETFSVSVPNEKAVAVTQVKLLIPKGVEDVTPTDKAGWTIQEEKRGDTVMGITWTGSIPAGFRDDFSFSAQAPGKAAQLNWKAYQTYADGTVVHWDQKPAGSDDATGDAGPYSITKVSDDLTTSTQSKSSSNNITLVIALVALVLSIIAFQRRPKL